MSASILDTVKTFILVMVSNKSFLSGLNSFRLHEDSDESQARIVQVSCAMSLNNGGSPTLVDVVGTVRTIDLAHLNLHQTRQMITRKAIYVDVLMGNYYPIVDSLDAHMFRFTALEQNVHKMMTYDPLLPSLIVILQLRQFIMSCARSYRSV